jgi:hypothetical protein
MICNPMQGYTLKGCMGFKHFLKGDPCHNQLLQHLPR